jgi:DNA invertase Pin-like site-specific DNA recombinase
MYWIVTASKRERKLKIGYVRVSTNEQNTIRQEELLRELNVEKMYIDKASGKSKERPELERMMDFVREGDVVIVESISRFARNARDLLELIGQLSAKDVCFVSKKEAIDTQTHTGKFMLTVFAAVAELERENILQRQYEGIAIAKAQGKYKGRKAGEYPGFEKLLEKVRCGEATAAAAMKTLGMSKTTWYRKIRESRS